MDAGGSNNISIHCRLDGCFCKDSGLGGDSCAPIHQNGMRMPRGEVLPSSNDCGVG